MLTNNTTKQIFLRKNSQLNFGPQHHAAQGLKYYTTNINLVTEQKIKKYLISKLKKTSINIFNFKVKDFQILYKWVILENCQSNSGLLCDEFLALNLDLKELILKIGNKLNLDLNHWLSIEDVFKKTFKNEVNVKTFNFKRWEELSVGILYFASKNTIELIISSDTSEFYADHLLYYISESWNHSYLTFEEIKNLLERIYNFGKINKQELSNCKIRDLLTLVACAKYADSNFYNIDNPLKSKLIFNKKISYNNAKSEMIFISFLIKVLNKCLTKLNCDSNFNHSKGDVNFYVTTLSKHVKDVITVNNF